MIGTEKAFDMLPFVAEIYEKTDLANYALKVKKQKKIGYNQEELKLIEGMNVIAHILKKAPTIKNEIFDIVAIAQEKDIEDVKTQPLTETLLVFKEIITDKELIAFFKGAVR